MSETSNKRDCEAVFIAVMLAVTGLVIWHSLGPPLTHWWRVHHAAILVMSLLVFVACLLVLVATLYNRHLDQDFDRAYTAPSPTSIYLGRNEKGSRLHLSQPLRTQHIQLIGTTGCGKTESVVLPWAIRDIESGCGVVIIDGKSDIAFLEKLYAYVKLSGRADEFNLFSLAHHGPSKAFNPLMGADAKLIAERVFAGFTFENLYYKDLQFQIFEALMSLIMECRATPTFLMIEKLLTDSTLLNSWLTQCNNPKTKRALSLFASLPEEKRYENVSGLLSQIGHFTSDGVAPLFNPAKGGMSLDEIIGKGQICYFQLPTMYYQFLAAATGKLVLQTLQNVFAKRQVGHLPKTPFVGCYLDDFQDYMYPEFAGLFNKTRSSNVSVLLSHQSLGDLDRVSPAFRDTVISCTNVKIVMRTNEPVSTDYLAKFFGTQTSEKTTERQVRAPLITRKTGEGSVREVEEYVHHPNTIKHLPVGQGIVSFPHPMGTKVAKVRFSIRENIAPSPLPDIPKETPDPNDSYSPPATCEKAKEEGLSSPSQKT